VCSGTQYLRLSVEPGGCEGFQYLFRIDDQPQDQLSDVCIEQDGAKFVVDKVSLEMVKGAQIDYVEEIVKSAFVVAKNPNAESGCGCGHSFNPL
jgi:iron-sulfur cluster assembly accessory protein